MAIRLPVSTDAASLTRAVQTSAPSDPRVPPPVSRIEAGTESPTSPVGPGQAAAQYIRMSTDHQECSIVCQLDAIAQYAQQHNLHIVRTYADEGISGLTTHGRGALLSLLDDVCTGRAPFRTLLVYDVSRWGRFQDSDESAYYEFLCRRAGIRVEYCMEQFTNDGSAMASVLKQLKRIMAAEYSRELSVKTFVAKCKLIRLGYVQGGMAGLGLRRMVVDSKGRPRGILERGEHKFLQEDRIVLVPGPKREVELVRWIFRQIADHHKLSFDIAESLNKRGKKTCKGVAWSAESVNALVANEKYIGNLIYNRRSMKLQSPTVCNPKSSWVRKDGAFEAIIDRPLFDRAQLAMSRWTRRITDEAALELLANLLKAKGKLTERLINEAPGMPHSRFYELRFGGLGRAYALVGYEVDRNFEFVTGYGERLRTIRAIRPEVDRRLRERGFSVRRVTASVIVLNESFRVGVLLAWCRIRNGRPHWLVQHHDNIDWLVSPRLNPENSAVQDYWLVTGAGHSVALEVKHRRVQAVSADRLDTVLDMLCEQIKAKAA